MNVLIPPQHFRMETLAIILPTLSPQDRAVSIDLKDAYLHVPVHPSSQSLLGVSISESHLRLSGPPFWPERLPLGVYSSGRHPHGSPPTSRDPSPLLPGRLVDRGSFPEPSPFAPSGDPHLCSIRGLSDQLGEVLSSSFPDSHFCRAHRGGGETKGSKLRPSVLRPPPVRDAYKNLNNFPTLHLFVTKLGW